MNDEKRIEELKERLARLESLPQKDSCDWIGIEALRQEISLLADSVKWKKEGGWL
jgi:hypothetical protein